MSLPYPIPPQVRKYGSIIVSPYQLYTHPVTMDNPQHIMTRPRTSIETEVLAKITKGADNSNRSLPHVKLDLNHKEVKRHSSQTIDEAPSNDSSDINTMPHLHIQNSLPEPTSPTFSPICRTPNARSVQY
jgi:hypothetical protein